MPDFKITPQPSGWHPDPKSETSNQLRWWDGTDWTEHVKPDLPAASRLKRSFLMTTGSGIKRPVPLWRFIWSHICLGVAVGATAYLIYNYSVQIPELLKSNPADPGWASLGFFMAPIIIGPFMVIPIIASIILRWRWLNITGLAVMLMLLPVPYVFDAVGVTRSFWEP